VSYADSVLSEMFTNATSVRLMEHAATLDLEDFEDPDLQDSSTARAARRWAA
jgi:ATP-binding cassette subfamily B protein